jgi:hypothetical protein
MINVRIKAPKTLLKPKSHMRRSYLAPAKSLNRSLQAAAETNRSGYFFFTAKLSFTCQTGVAAAGSASRYIVAFSSFRSSSNFT